VGGDFAAHPAVLGIGVFCVFATFGVLLDVPRQAHVPLPYLALYAFLMGLMAVCYAFALLWDQRLLPIGIALLLLNSSLGRWVSRPGRGLVLSPEATHARLRTDTIVSIALIALGYQAGVLMAMLKSAARTTLAGGGSLPAMLAHFNRTICELERPGIFATCAALRVGAAGAVEYALAGHPPIFMRCARSGAVRELDAAGPPLGLDAAAAYARRRSMPRPGTSS
jgi:hypothetical protein